MGYGQLNSERMTVPCRCHTGFCSALPSAGAVWVKGSVRGPARDRPGPASNPTGRELDETFFHSHRNAKMSVCCYANESTV